MQITMEQLIKELKKILFEKQIRQEDLKNHFASIGYDSDTIEIIILEMHRMGFSFMNGMVTYRGENYVAKTPPSQNS